MNKLHRQEGSAHVVIIVILVIIVIGALGFVFWQNFVNKKDVTTDSPTPKVEATTSTDTEHYKSYERLVAFDYLTNGWKFSDSTQVLQTEEVARLDTPDFKEGAGADPRHAMSGAEIRVYVGPTRDEDIVQMHQDQLDNIATQKSFGETVTVGDIVSGKGGNRFSFEYANAGELDEIILVDNVYWKYDITYYYANGLRDKYMPAFQKIVDTLSAE